jgi:hypothetical protein
MKMEEHNKLNGGNPMGKRILAVVLVLLTLFALGCSKASKDTKDEEIAQAQEQTIESTPVPLGQEGTTPSDEETVPYASFWFSEEEAIRFINVLLGAHKCSLGEREVMASESNGESTETDVSTIAYQFITEQKGSHAGVFIDSANSNIIRISIYCTDYENYQDEYTNFCFYIIQFCDPMMTNDTEGTNLIIQSIIPNDGIYLNNGIQYRAATTEDGYRYFIVQREN